MRNLDIILLGVGGVGRALLRQVLEHRGFHAARYGLNLRLIALYDHSGMIADQQSGLSDEILKEAIQLKKEGGRLSSHRYGHDRSAAPDLRNVLIDASAVVVDCTNSQETIPALLWAVDNDHKIVLANKKPLTAEQSIFDRLTAPIQKDRLNNNPREPRIQCRWETTVGAGLPVITTLNRLVASGDMVSRIMCTCSGTLSFLMTELQEGKAFSEIVVAAKRQGYTEPDPRDDLSGMDVARKALIMARCLGWEVELDAIAVESLYPEEMKALSLESFMSEIATLDHRIRKQVEEAAAQAQALRYVATVSDGRCEVGLRAVPKASPLGRLTGMDNLFEINSSKYSPNPLVIQGRGAGVEATAAGVLSDIMELAFVK